MSQDKKKITADDIIYNDDRLSRIKMATEIYEVGMKCTDYIIAMGEDRYPYIDIPELSLECISRALLKIENEELSSRLKEILTSQSIYLYQNLKDIYDDLDKLRNKVILSRFDHHKISNQMVIELNEISGMYTKFKKNYINQYSYTEQFHNILEGYAMLYLRARPRSNTLEDIKKCIKTLYCNIREICSDIIKEIVIIEDVERRF